MPDETQQFSRAGDELGEILAEYVAAEDAGRSPDRSALLARYPHLEGELREFFANRDQIQRLAAPIRSSERDGVFPKPTRWPKFVTLATTSYWRKSPRAEWELSTRLGR